MEASDARAKELYDACQTVKPEWSQLGEVTRGVWREYAAQGRQPEDWLAPAPKPRKRVPVNPYQTFFAMLRIDKHNLDTALERQPEIMQQIAERVAELNTEQITAKEELAKAEAKIVTRLKEEDPKATVAAIEAVVRRDSSRQSAWNTYQDLRQEHERWSALLEAWSKRGFAIKTLADLYIAQYFTTDTHRAPAQEEARAAMREANSTPPRRRVSG